MAPEELAGTSVLLLARLGPETLLPKKAEIGIGFVAFDFSFSAILVRFAGVAGAAYAAVAAAAGAAAAAAHGLRLPPIVG